MTTTPDPSVPLDFNQLRQAQAEATEKPAIGAKSTLVVGRREYPIVPKLTVSDQLAIVEAQEQGGARDLIEAVVRVVKKPHREELLAYLLDDPDDDADRVSLEELMAEVDKVTEAIAARP